jgi:hypothetical protein
MCLVKHRNITTWRVEVESYFEITREQFYNPTLALELKVKTNVNCSAFP